MSPASSALVYQEGIAIRGRASVIQAASSLTLLQPRSGLRVLLRACPDHRDGEGLKKKRKDRTSRQTHAGVGHSTHTRNGGHPYVRNGIRRTQALRGTIGPFA